MTRPTAGKAAAYWNAAWHPAVSSDAVGVASGAGRSRPSVGASISAAAEASARTNPNGAICQADDLGEVADHVVMTAPSATALAV